MESAHQFSFIPDCNNTAEVPSFTLRTALSAIPLVSDRCGVAWFCPGKRCSSTYPLSNSLPRNSIDCLDNFLHNQKNEGINQRCRGATTLLSYHVGNVVLKCADMRMFRWMHDCFSSELEPGKMGQCCACWWDKHVTAGRINRVENCADYGFVCWQNSRSSSRISFGQGFLVDASPRRDNTELSCLEYKSQYLRHS